MILPALRSKGLSDLRNVNEISVLITLGSLELNFLQNVNIFRLITLAIDECFWWLLFGPYGLILFAGISCQIVVIRAIATPRLYSLSVSMCY